MKAIADAQYQTGTSYANGEGVEQSFTKAREWLKKAATQGHEEAINNLKSLDEIEGIKTTFGTNNSPWYIFFRQESFVSF